MINLIELQRIQELTWNKHEGLMQEVWQFYLLNL